MANVNDNVRPGRFRLRWGLVWGLTAIAVAGFGARGIAQLTGEAAAVAVFQTAGFPAWTIAPVSVAIIAAALLLLLRPVAYFAALALMGFAVGGCILHLIVGDWLLAGRAIAFFAVAGAVCLLRFRDVG